jgi:predicted kinase
LKKQWLIVLCGISGSGKSTKVSQLRKAGLEFVELNRDEWRWKLHTNDVPDWSKYKFTDKKEKAVNEKIEELFTKAVADMMPIIVSNTNLNLKDHNYWKQKALDAGYDFEVQYVDVTLEDALKRDRRRGALSVGRDIIFEQWQKWLKITNFRKYVPDVTKPLAVICDIDGCIATVDGRSHYDYSKVSTDLPREFIMDMVFYTASAYGAKIIFVSGRDDICYDDTKQWIQSTFIPKVGEGQLFMRKTEDKRNDRIVKQEIFWEHIADNYNVIAAFDDRPRVIRLWNDIGIPNVVSVQQGYHEF